VHTGKELEVHQVEKGRLSCNSDAPQVRSAQSDSTRVIKLNHHKTNHHKMRPHCIKFHADPSSGSPVVQCGQVDRWTGGQT